MALDAQVAGAEHIRVCDRCGYFFEVAYEEVATSGFSDLVVGPNPFHVTVQIMRELRSSPGGEATLSLVLYLDRDRDLGLGRGCSNCWMISRPSSSSTTAWLTSPRRTASIRGAQRSRVAPTTMTPAGEFGRFTLVANFLGKDEAIRLAFDRLRESGVHPLVCDATEPSIWVAPEQRSRALTVLLASGFEIQEL